MERDLAFLRANVADATNEDLLDRVTVYREGMEPEALTIIEAELRRRGITPEDIDAHTDLCRDVLRGPDGVALRCWECKRPAVCKAWRWFKLHGILPVFPWLQPCCTEHRPRA